MKKIHDRMPVFLSLEDHNHWLDPKLQDKEELKSLLVPYRADEVTKYPVAKVVNNPRNEVPECIEPIDSAEIP